MAERAAERVAGAEAADHLDGHGRDLDDLAVSRGAQDPLGTLLDDRRVRAELEQSLRLLARRALAHGDRRLGLIADDDVGALDGLGRPVLVPFAVWPEHR